jgi:hypothetical protein
VPSKIVDLLRPRPERLLPASLDRDRRPTHLLWNSYSSREIEMCSPDHDHMTIQTTIAVRRSAGVIELPDEAAWIGTGGGAGYGTPRNITTIPCSIPRLVH